MGSVGNQNPWSPYDTYKDCSLGICSIYCPQLCYFLFPPPPPPSDGESSTPFSPLIIAIIGILASAFLLVSYYTIVTRYCTRSGNQNAGVEETNHEQWQQVGSTGLDEAIIKTITVCKYQRGQGLIEGTECSVCLADFQENESLRLLPKCSHAFHLPCIDTWLKSQSSCPLCRANVTHPSPPPILNAQTSHDDHNRNIDSTQVQRPNDLILVVDDQENDEDLKSPVQESVHQLRRSISLGAFPFEISDVESWREIGSSMKRCNSTAGRFMLIDQNKGNSSLLPH